jgi:hypothetical protein
MISVSDLKPESCLSRGVDGRKEDGAWLREAHRSFHAEGGPEIRHFRYAWGAGMSVDGSG